MIQIFKILITILNGQNNKPTKSLYKQEQSNKNKLLKNLRLTQRQKNIIKLFLIILALILFVALCYALIPSGTDSGLVYNKFGMSDI